MSSPKTAPGPNPEQPLAGPDAQPTNPSAAFKPAPERTKRCSRCKIEKPISQFYRRASRRDGFTSHCKSCAWIYEQKPERKAAEAQRHKTPKVKKRQREYYRTVGRNLFLRRTYGLSVLEWDALYATQNGNCASCGHPMTRKEAHVDHCHSTNKVRGLLHGKCNTGLGHFNDSPVALIKAARYLTVARLGDLVAGNRAALIAKWNQFVGILEIAREIEKAWEETNAAS